MYGDRKFMIGNHTVHDLAAYMTSKNKFVKTKMLFSFDTWYTVRLSRRALPHDSKQTNV